MGLRIAIGAIIAVLLGGTGYFAQESHTTKNQLQKREIELSAEKDNTAKLNLRFKTIEQQMKGLQSRLDKEGTSAKTEIQEMSRQIAEKSASLDQEKAKIQGLEMTLKHIQTARDDERKMRAEAEEANKQNIGLAANRAEEIQRLETQAEKMSHLVAEKSASLEQEKAKIQNLEITLKQIQTARDDERKMRAEAEEANKQNIGLAANRAEEIQRLESQAEKMSHLVADQSADIKQQKAEIRNLKTTLDIINNSLNNERRMGAEAEKANKQNIEITSKRAEEMSHLVAEQSADIKQEKAKIQGLEMTLKHIQTARDDERKMRAEAEEANKQNIGLAANRAEEIQRLETQAEKMSHLVAEKSADIKQEKAKIQGLEMTLKHIQTARDDERKMRAEAEEANKQNIGLAANRAEEIQRLETQAEKMSHLVAEKSADIKQEKAKIQGLEMTLKHIQTARDDERKMRAEAEEANKQNIGLAANRAEEIQRLETQAEKMSHLVAEKSASLEQEKAKIQNLEITLKQIQTARDDERKMRADVEKSNKQNLGLAANRAEEIQRLESQAEKMSHLVADQSADIKQQKAEIRNLKTTLDIINNSLNNERRMGAEAEKANKQNIGLAANRAEEIQRLETQAEKMSHLVAEKSASLEQEKAKIQNLEITLKQIQTARDDERKMRADVEKSNKQNLGLAANRAEEIQRLESQAEKMSHLVADQSADIKQQKAEIRNLKTTLDIINNSLNNERRMGAEAEKANKQNIEITSKRAEEMSHLVAEQSADIKQQKAEIRNLKTTLDIINNSLNNERKMRAEAEKGNKQNIEIASKRAEEMSRLINEKSADIKQEKTEIRNLKSTLDILNSSLDNERKMRADVEKSNKQNLELAANRAEETKRLEKIRALLQAQVVKMRQLIAMKSTDIEQEKGKTQNLESALKRIHTTLETERKMRTEAEKASKQNIKLAGRRAEEIRRLEKARERLETQVGKMRKLIAEKTADIEQEKAKTQNLESALQQIQVALETERKTRVEIEKSHKRNLELARNRAEEMKRLEQTREILNTQVQEMSRLIAEKNTDIEQEKTKAQNLKLALEQIQKTLESERKARTKVEESNVQNAELARKRVEEINQLQKARELLKAQVQEMSQLIAEKTSVAELIKNKLDQTNLSLSETIKKHTLAIARSKILEKKAREEAERAQKLESDLNELNKKLKKQFVSLQQTKDLLRVTFVNSLLFDSGSARLREKGLEALLSVAEFLQKQKDKVIRVEGHTDNQPIKGNLLDRYPSNWELSSARAVSIVKFLESNNISPARMSATGHSFYRPVASNDTGDGRAKNRRTDILLSNRTPKAAATTP